MLTLLHPVPASSIISRHAHMVDMLHALSQVVWVPTEPATLISASDDGLVSVFDFAEALDEDDSWRAALNLDGAVAKMGFYGAAGEKLWMVSQLAGLHLWEWKAACTEDAAGDCPLQVTGLTSSPTMMRACCGKTSLKVSAAAQQQESSLQRSSTLIHSASDSIGL